MTITNKQNCKTSGFFEIITRKTKIKINYCKLKKIQLNSCTILSNPKITLQIYFFELKLYEYFCIYMYISIYVNIHVFLKYLKLSSLHHLHLSSRNALLNKVPIYQKVLSLIIHKTIYIARRLIFFNESSKATNH